MDINRNISIQSVQFTQYHYYRIPNNNEALDKIHFHCKIIDRHHVDVIVSYN